jgi:sirohydrochlorin cobaltochelatase
MSAAPLYPSLLLVAHGSSRHPNSVRPVQEIAELIAARGLFKSVKAVFMKAEPLANEDALDRDGPTIVVPIFMGQGYYTDTVVPKILGVVGNPRVTYTAPLGTHPRIADLMMNRALAAARYHQVQTDQAVLYLVAHGSAKSAASGDSAAKIETALRQMGLFKQVELGFLEQEPKAEFWRDSVSNDPIIILPLLVAAGTHTNQDIPSLFGFEDGIGGHRVENGRPVVLASSIGIEPDLVDLVIDLAKCHYDGPVSR